MNRILYPASSYPLSGDLQSQPGSTQTTVTGLQNVPLTAVSFNGGEILTYDGATGAWVPTQITGNGNQFYATPNGAAGLALLRAILPADLPIATLTALGVMFPDGTTCTVDSAGKLSATGGGGGLSRVPHDVTVSRTFGGVYQNTSGVEMWVTGWAQTSPGGSTGDMVAMVDSVDPPVLQVWGNEATATVSGGKAGFSFPVPNGYYYQIISTGAIPNESKWVEYY